MRKGGANKRRTPPAKRPASWGGAAAAGASSAPPPEGAAGLLGPPEEGAAPATPPPVPLSQSEPEHHCSETVSRRPTASGSCTSHLISPAASATQSSARYARPDASRFCDSGTDLRPLPCYVNNSGCGQSRGKAPACLSSGITEESKGTFWMDASRLGSIFPFFKVRERAHRDWLGPSVRVADEWQGEQTPPLNTKV